MRNLKIFFLIFIIIAGVSKLSGSYEKKTMYACCSPYGLCDLRVFDSKPICMRLCGGHNFCRAKTVHIVPHPVYGFPIAQLASDVSSTVTGYTTEGTQVVSPGAVTTIPYTAYVPPRAVIKKVIVTEAPKPQE